MNLSVAAALPDIGAVSCDETEAVRLCKRGDPAGLETLVRLHQRRALRAAALIVRDPALAEDVAADAFLNAFKWIGSFDASRPFAPWFHRVVVTTALRALERRKGERPLEADAHDRPSSDEPLDARVGRLDDARDVRAALASLPPRQRAALVLRYYGDLNEAEIAAALGIPRGTVKSRVFAGLARLRAALANSR